MFMTTAPTHSREHAGCVVVRFEGESYANE